MVTCPFCGREVNPTQAKELEELMDVEWAVPLQAEVLPEYSLDEQW